MSARSTSPSSARDGGSASEATARLAALVLELLLARREQGHELAVRDLRSALSERARYPGGQRLAAATALLARSGLVYTTAAPEGGYGRRGAVIGLTQRAVELIRRDGLAAVIADCLERRGIRRSITEAARRRRQRRRLGHSARAATDPASPAGAAPIGGPPAGAALVAEPHTRAALVAEPLTRAALVAGPPT